MRTFLFLIFLCFTGNSFILAQQIHQYTQYMFNQYSHNPAVGGSKECMDVKIGYRIQWVGFESAPQTGYGSIYSRLKSKRQDPLEGYHGIGIYIENDETLPSSRTYIYPSYAYHQPLNQKITASAGIFAGIQQYKFKIDDITLFDPVDNAINGSKSIIVKPDISVGLWLYGEDFYGGIAAKQLLSKKIEDGSEQFGIDSRIVKHYNLTTGYKITGRKQISYIPSVMIKYLASAPVAIDINCMADFKNRLTLGLSYRNKDAIAALVKFKLFKYFDLGYSYDYSISKIRIASSNTHEITLGIYDCMKDSFKREKNCPAYD